MASPGLTSRHHPPSQAPHTCPRITALHQVHPSPTAHCYSLHSRWPQPFSPQAPKTHELPSTKVLARLLTPRLECCIAILERGGGWGRSFWRELGSWRRESMRPAAAGGGAQPGQPVPRYLGTTCPPGDHLLTAAGDQLPQGHPPSSEGWGPCKDQPSQPSHPTGVGRPEGRPTLYDTVLHCYFEILFFISKHNILLTPTWSSLCFSNC